MIIIGLTGPSGAGKGLCSAYLQAHGIPCIDTDRVYHDLLTPSSPCTNELALAFGQEILAPDGTVDRKVLGRIVFSDGTGGSAKRLNRIAHKYVIEETWRILALYKAEGKAAAVIDAPLLIEAELDQKCDFCICVLADKDVRLARIMERDGIDVEVASLRLSAQKEDSFYSSACKYTLYNNGNENALYAALLQIFETEEIPLEA